MIGVVATELESESAIYTHPMGGANARYGSLLHLADLQMAMQGHSKKLSTPEKLVEDATSRIIFLALL